MRNFRLVLFGCLLVVIPMSVAGQAQRQLEVLLAAPQGHVLAIDQTQTIFASFNLPMVPLRAVPVGEASGPLLIQPSVKGKYRWMGTKTIAFLPADTLPYSTSFTVHVPAGTKSLSGQSLQSEFRWQFETPRPRIIRTSPYSGQRFVELDHSILMQFNQNVDPQKTSAFISLIEIAGNQRSYPTFIARQPSADELKMDLQRFGSPIDKDKCVLLLPAVPLKKGRSYMVKCKAGLPGTEGPLGMQEEFTLPFSTINELEFKGVGLPAGFSPAQPLRLIFSNPVSIKEVARHLVIDPPVRFDADEIGYDYETTEPYLPIPLEAEKQYNAMLKAGLKDRFGNSLPHDVPFSFRTGSFSPYVRMTTGPGVIEGKQLHRYPVTFMNIDSVLLQQGVVTPDRIVPLMRRIQFSQNEAFEQGMMPDGLDATRDTMREIGKPAIWRIKTARNKPTVLPVDLDKVLGSDGRGMVFLQIDNLRPDPDRRYLKALLQVTDIGITGKFSSEANLIWITRLSDAVPIADVLVEIRNDSNQVIWSGRTDANGLVQSPGWGLLGLPPPNEWQQPRQWIIARSSDDFAFSSSEWQRGIEPWTFDVNAEWQPRFEPLQGLICTDRGLYRAGENVEIKAVVRSRKENGWRIPINTHVQLTIRNSRNEEVYKKDQVLSAFGSCALTFPLPPGASLGYYTMTLESKKLTGTKEQWEEVGSGSFRVEAFRAAEFEVTARSALQSYIVGDIFKGYLSARYLFGAALKGEPVTWRISTTSASWSPPGWERYFFGPLQWLSRYVGRAGYRVLSSKQQNLDAEGALQVQCDLKVGDIAGTSSLILEADVTAPSRQQISGRTSVLVHGGEYYIGIAPSGTFVQSDSTLRYALIAVTPEGKSITGVPLSVKVMRRLWRSVRKAESGGRYSWESEAVDETADSLSVRTTDSPLELSFRTRQAGFYFIQGEGKDSRGNGILSQSYFYVSGSGYVAWERDNDDRIDLVSDKTNYAPGALAHLLVKSPYEEAIALITVEREGILKRLTRKLTGSAPQIDLPIQREYLPNVFVSVVLLQGRKDKPPAGTGDAAKKESDVGKPSFKVGYLKLSVSPEETHLRVQVATDRRDYRPGDSVQVRVLVHNAAGAGVPAELTISTADMGVLNLIGYRLPDVFNFFYAERPLGVRTTETRIHIVEQREYGEKGEDVGGGGSEENAAPLFDAEGIRKNFRSTAYWNPSANTNSQGELNFRFRLPDNLTSFRVMVVAQTLNSEFGYGDTILAVNKPLLLQPSFPRFARTGDAFDGGVVLHNYTSDEKHVVLLVKARGVKFTGRDSSIIELKPGQALEVRNRCVAEKPGNAVFAFRAVSGGDVDGLQWTIPVQATRMSESVALNESFSDTAANEQISVPSAIHADAGGIQFHVASTPLVELAGGVSYLFAYPYGCLEQRLSAVLPLILAKDIVEAFRLEVFKEKDYKLEVRRALDELPAFQREGGGFSYWKNGTVEQPYVSAYAMYAMVHARRAGFDVNARMIENGLQYLRRVLSNEAPFTQYDQAAWYSTRALILYTLALLEKPEYGYMEKLYAAHAELPLFGEAYLLRALTAVKGNPTMIQNLVRDLTNKAKVSPTSAHFEERDNAGLAWVFDSNVRTTALVLQALVEAEPQNPLIPAAVRWVLGQRKNGMWRTTQENLYVVDALATYFRTFERDEPDFRIRVNFDSEQVINGLFKGRTLSVMQGTVPMSRVKPGSRSRIVLRKEGPGKCYYEVRMTYAPTGEMNAKEEGMTVVKTVEPLGGEQPGNNTYKAGSVLRVTLTVITNQSRNFLVVNDPLPAGFETITTSFQTTAMELSQQRNRDETDQWWRFSPFDHSESYDDHVLVFADFMPAGVHSYSYLARATSLGRFTMPSTHVEAMYEPEVFGQTASQTVIVGN